MNDKKTNQREALASTRDGFGRGLVEAAIENERVVAVSADLAESTRLHWFAESFPSRFFEVGVAEQNLVGIAAGLALADYIPVAASYACFSPANSWGVIRTSACYSNLHVILVGGHAGLTTGEDGASHQSLEDLATMRVLPNMTVIAPADGEQARQAILAAIHHPGALYIRTSKANAQPLPTHEDFEIGKAQQLKSGSELTIIACGTMVQRVLSAAVELEERSGISVRVLNMHTIKPLDNHALQSACSETQALLTVEDHQAAGGLGSAVAEFVVNQAPYPPLRILGVSDAFGQSGVGEELLDLYGLSTDAIVQAGRDILDQAVRARAHWL